MGHNPQHSRGPQPIRWHYGHGDLNAHSHLWDTNQPSDTRGKQLEDWVIAHYASALNDGTATLLNRATGDLSSPGFPLTDKAEWKWAKTSDPTTFPFL